MIDTNFLLRKPCLAKLQAFPNEICQNQLSTKCREAEKQSMLITSEDLFLLSIRAFYFKLDKTFKCDFVSLLEQIFNISEN